MNIFVLAYGQGTFIITYHKCILESPSCLFHSLWWWWCRFFTNFSSVVVVLLLLVAAPALSYALPIAWQKAHSKFVVHPKQQQFSHTDNILCIRCILAVQMSLINV